MIAANLVHLGKYSSRALLPEDALHAASGVDGALTNRVRKHAGQPRPSVGIQRFRGPIHGVETLNPIRTGPHQIYARRTAGPVYQPEISVARNAFDVGIVIRELNRTADFEVHAIVVVLPTHVLRIGGRGY